MSNSNYDAFHNLIQDIFERMPLSEVDKAGRYIHAMQSTPRSQEPFINFMALVNPYMPKGTRALFTTGLLANLSNLMSDPSIRLSPDVVMVAPPLSGPTPSISLSTGDIEVIRKAVDALKSDDQQSTSSRNKLNSVTDAVDSLDEVRQMLKQHIASDLRLQKKIFTICKAAVDAAKKVKEANAGFIETYTNILREEEGLSPISLKDKSQDYNFVVNRNVMEAVNSSVLPLTKGDPFTGGIPVAALAVLFQVGKFIVTYGPLILDLWNWCFGSKETPIGTVKVVTAGQPTDLLDKTYATLTSSIGKAGYSNLVSKISEVEASTKNLISTLDVGDNQHPNAKEWRKVYVATMLPRLVTSSTIDMMDSLSKSYKSKNPDQPALSNMLVPRTNVPLPALMASVWDPLAIQDEDIAWKDFLDYFHNAVKYNASMASLPGKEKVEDFESRFKNGAKFWNNDASSEDGWDDVTKLYLSTYYPGCILKFFGNFKKMTEDSFKFSSRFGGVDANVTPQDVFPNGDYSSFHIWDPSYISTFNSRVSSIKSSKKGSTNKVVNQKEDVTVNVNPNPPVNNQPENSVVNQNDVINQNQIIGPMKSVHGTILITPDETLINSGSYQDPTTGSMSNFSDLYELGKRIKESREKVSLYYSIPHLTTGDVMQGDVLQGGILSGLVKTGVNLLSKTKVGKKIVNKVTDVAKKIPIVKSFIKTEPESVTQVAAQTAKREEEAVKSLARDASSLPIDPNSAMDALSKIQEITELLKDTNSKMGLVLDELSRIQIASHSMTNDLVVTGDPFYSIKHGKLGGNSVPLSLGDVLVGSLTGSPIKMHGDIEIWRLQH